MDRRSFLRQVTLWTAGLAAAKPLFRLPVSAQVDPAAQSMVAVSQGKDYSVLVRQVLDAAGGIQGFVKKNSRVVVKPNIGWDRSPELAATTHPNVVTAVIEQCLHAGASSVMVFDRTCNDERRCYLNSGILAAVESMKDPRVRIDYIDQRKFVPVRIEKGKSVVEWEFYKDVLDADCYINVPIAKQHGLSRLTLGMKNIMGVIGGIRGKIHHDIGQRLADLNLVVKPSLTIIDATRILLRNGPQGGDLSDVKVTDTLIASSDMIAADAYATTLFGLEPSEIGSTVAGYQMGIGEMNLSRVKIIKA